MAHPLEPFIPVCDAIALLLRPHAEAVLHELASQTIFYIANSYSKRRAGDSSLNDPAESFDSSADVIGPYAKTNWNGRRIRSVTSVIRDSDHKPIGLLCINHDVEAFAGALEQLRQIVEFAAGPARQPSSLLSQDWRESINTMIAKFLAARDVTFAGLTNADVDALLVEFQQQGVFEIRKAVPYVASVLRLSRATIYNRLGSLQHSAPEHSGAPNQTARLRQARRIR